MKIGKKAQEEMVGFALIIIIVAVILLIFLGFSLKKPQKEAVESYEIESFIEAFLQYTSDCKNDRNIPLSIKELIISCNKNEKCYENSNEKESCEVLNEIMTGIIGESWKTDLIKGYELNIFSDKELLSLESGEKTKNYRGSSQDIPSEGNLIEVVFVGYY